MDRDDYTDGKDERIRYVQEGVDTDKHNHMTLTKIDLINLLSQCLEMLKHHHLVLSVSSDEPHQKFNQLSLRGDQQVSRFDLFLRRAHAALETVSFRNDILRKLGITFG